MTQTLKANTITIERNELSSLLREVVREVVREELNRFAAQEADWEIEEGSILGEDLSALQADRRAGTLKLLSHAEKKNTSNQHRKMDHRPPHLNPRLRQSRQQNT